MSTLENVIWHILGYGTMPFIFLAGFIGVAAISLWLLSLGADKDTQEPDRK